MPNYNEMEHVFDIVDNISQGWQQIKSYHSKDDQQTRNVIIPVILSELTSSIQKTNLLTSIHRRNLTLVIIKKLFFESHNDNMSWALYKKLKMRDAIIMELCDIVMQFWTKNSQTNPNIRRNIVLCNQEIMTTSLK